MHSFSLLNALLLSVIIVRSIIDGNSVIPELSKCQFQNACSNSILTHNCHVFVQEWVQYFFQLFLRSETIITVCCEHILGWDVEGIWDVSLVKNLLFSCVDYRFPFDRVEVINHFLVHSESISLLSCLWSLTTP